MDHSFFASLSDDKVCGKCKRDFRSHTSIAQCECCPNIGTCEIYKTMLMCKDCLAKEKQADADAANPVIQEQRVAEAAERHTQQIIDKYGSASNFVVQDTGGPIPLSSVLTAARDIDQSIRIVPDIFNAKTIALVDVMKAIDADESISNKAYAKAEFSVNRIKHLKAVISEHKQMITEWENEQRANQIFLNTQANQLRAEEREKLKIADISYNPQAPKVVKPRSVSTTGNKTKKFDKVKALEQANRAGTTIDVIRAFMVANPGMDEIQAADKYLAATGKVS